MSDAAIKRRKSSVSQTKPENTLEDKAPTKIEPVAENGRRKYILSDENTKRFKKFVYPKFMNLNL